MKWPIRYVTNDLGLLLMYTLVRTSRERKFSPLTLASKNSNNNFWLATTFAISRPVLNQFQNWEFKDDVGEISSSSISHYHIGQSQVLGWKPQCLVLSHAYDFLRWKLVNTIIFRNLAATFNYCNFLGIRSAVFRKFTIASYNSVFLL